MNLRQKIANVIAPTAKNAADSNLAQEYLRHGNRRQLMSNWAQIGMSDRDLYTGYMFGAIDERANTVVELAEEHLLTKAAPAIMEASKKKNLLVTHPYFSIIDNSGFPNEDLWYNYSTYIDLEGVFYLVAVRNVTRKDDGSPVLVGGIQYFKLVSPYNMTPVRNAANQEIGGYTEYYNGLVRDWPVEMVIPIRRLNPFSDTENFGVADAAKDDQFTLKSAKDYTNNSLAGNINAPGIISTGVELTQPQFENFRARVVNHEKGEPLFGNGSGKIDWKSMQSDLEKAALDKINQISLTGIIASTRVSKTSLGIEESGVTRDTSKVQDDRLIGKVGIPQLRRLIGALNQDYRRYYEKDYKKDQYQIVIDNPLKTDRDAELKDVEVNQSRYNLYISLVDKGYKADVAAQYAAGDITLAELGEPTEKPAAAATTQEPKPPADTATQSAGSPAPSDPGDTPEPLPQAGAGATAVTRPVTNAAGDDPTDADDDPLVLRREGILKAAVVQVQNRLWTAVMDKVTRNAFDKESDIVDQADKRQAINDLDLAVASYFATTMPHLGAQAMKRRLKDLGLEITAYPAYSYDREVKNYIAEAAKRAATSHIDTILSDVLEAVRSAAVEGVSRDQIISAIRKTFTETSPQRAELIAKTETYRAFTRSQYDADRQFLDSIGKRGQAKKKWRTRSGHPCAYCQTMAARPAIPFDEPFADIGDVVSADFILADGSMSVRKMPITYEPIQAGSLHPRCECDYELIIEDIK